MDKGIEMSASAYLYIYIDVYMWIAVSLVSVAMSDNATPDSPQRSSMFGPAGTALTS